MTAPAPKTPFVAIACGGTGGHLFPGLAVAKQLQKHGCDVALLISPKDIDRQAVKTVDGMDVFTLPAVGLQNRNYFSFAGSFVKSLFAARRMFKRRKPDAVLAMGGFTSAPPVLVAGELGVKTFLHESNSIPGRANRFLARFVGEAFVGFPGAAARLKARRVTTTGTPVRPEFSSSALRAPQSAISLGLDPNLPTVLVVGGSQGASGLNEMILSALPLLAGKNWQWLHLAGANDFEKVRAAYAAQNMKAVVKSFLAGMDLAFGAAAACVSRAGASSLAEIAAMQLPALLVPFPAAADNHQYFNALAFEKTGAAGLLEQKSATPEKTAAILVGLVESETVRSAMKSALARWHAPDSAGRIADAILQAVARKSDIAAASALGCGCGCARGSAKHATG